MTETTGHKKENTDCDSLSELFTAASKRADRHTSDRGYRLGAPNDRQRLALDDVIEDIIMKLPAEARLYPEVYAHMITDGILKCYGKLVQSTSEPEDSESNTP